MQPIRNSIKALLFRDGKVLAIKHEDAEGYWYVLPGGGQEPGETFHEALQRECLEEINTCVEIGPLRFIREYLGAKHEFADTEGDVHQVEFMFDCKLPPGVEPAVGHLPDTSQLDIEWLELATLGSYRLYPLAIRQLLVENEQISVPVYLGEMN